MSFHLHSFNKHSEYFESGLLPTWLDSFFQREHRSIRQDLISFEDSEIFDLSTYMTIYPEDRAIETHAFLAYHVASNEKLIETSIKLAKWLLDSIWGTNFEIITASDPQDIYLVNFSLYHQRSEHLKNISSLIEYTDDLLSRAIGMSSNSRKGCLAIPNVKRLKSIPLTILSQTIPKTMNPIDIDLSLATRYAHINLDQKTAMKRYIDLNPQHFIRSYNDKKHIYYIEGLPKILALEIIFNRDDFLKEIFVFRNGHCYLWNIGMLTNLRLEERGGDESIEVQNINVLALEQIVFYLKTFLDFEIDSETIRQTLNAIAEKKNDKIPFLSAIGQDKIDRANIFLTCFFCLQSGIVENFQADLVSSDVENFINFRNAQKFLVNIGNLYTLRDDFKMSALLKNYRFNLGLDIITIKHNDKGKKWEFFKNDVKCLNNPFQKDDAFEVDNDMMYFLKKNGKK